MVHNISISCILVCLSLYLDAQPLPQFSPPVKHKIALSGSFGELRTGHFHAGIDIKSKHGISGDSIISIDAGYVSRIKVEPGGYGYSLYINHPNGYTSVYAHLKQYEESIQEYVYQIQSEEKCFTIDHRPPHETFPLAQGQFIGVMGNTGRSFGAHLHFEIRQTADDKLINPLLFGIKPDDKKFPEIQTLVAYEYDTLHRIVGETEYDIIKYNRGTYQVRDTVRLNDQYNSELSIRMHDGMNGSYNKNGIYKLKLLVNEQLVQEFCFDSMDFNDSDGVDYFLDKKIKSDKKRNQYIIPISNENYPFSFSKQDSIYAHKEVKSILILASDFEGNTSTLKLNVSHNNVQQDQKPILTNYISNLENPTLIQLENFDLIFPKKSFFSRQAFFVKEINQSPKEGKEIKSLILGPSYVKLNKDIFVRFRALETQLSEKYCFVHVTDKGEFELLDNCKRNATCSTTINSFKNVMLIKDTIPPTITPLFLNKTLRPNSTISFKIKDNIKPKSKAHLLNYTAFLNGEWILFKYDLKSDIITHQIKDSINNGKYFLELQLTDNQQNTNCYYTEISIK